MVAVAEPESTSKTSGMVKTTYTRWDTFDKAGLGVTRIVCDCLPGHPADEACKTALIPSAKNVIDHINAGHGGGFRFYITETGRPWSGWAELAAAGVEVQGIRDEVNDHQVPVSVRALRAALRPHQGKFRGAYQAFNGQLLFSLAFTPPPASDDDAYEYPVTE